MPATTPDTTAYLLLGLTVFFLILLVFSASLVIRTRNLQKDAHLLDQLAEDDNR